MPKIHWKTIDQVSEVAPGTTLLDAALDNGVPLQHACGGFCSCTTCQIKVVSGQENLSPAESDEQERLEGIGSKPPEARLGCQAKILQGDIIVEIVEL